MLHRRRRVQSEAQRRLAGRRPSGLLDRGFQKFFQSSRIEIPATANHLRSLHDFSQELKEAIGGIALYNEAMGTTSDVYRYDRVKGRSTD